MKERKKKFSFLLAALFAIAGSASAATVENVTVSSGNTGEISVPNGPDNVLNVTNDVTVGTGAWGWVAGVKASAGAIVNVGGSINAIGNNTFGINASSTTIKVEQSITASGEGSRGIYAINNSDIEVNDLVEASGQNSMGVEVDTSEVKISGNVKASGDDSRGVKAADNSNIEVQGSVDASGSNSQGVEATSSEVKIVGNVEASGAGSRGVTAADNSNIEIEGSVDASGSNSRGVEATSSAVKITGSVEAAEQGSYGVYSTNSSDITITNGVTASGNNSRGIYAQSSKVDVTGNVTASGPSAYGIEADASTVKVTGNVTTGDNAIGIRAESSSDVTLVGDVTAAGQDSRGIYAQSSTVELTGNVVASASGARGIEADSSDVKVTGSVTATDSSIGIHSVSGSTVSISDGVEASGQGSFGIFANGSSTVSVAAGGVTASGNGSRGIYVQSSEVNVTGDVIASGQSAYGIEADTARVTVIGDVKAESQDAIGIRAQYSEIEITGSLAASAQDAIGVFITNDSNVDVMGNLLASNGGMGARIDSGALDLAGLMEVGTDSTGILATGADAVVNLNSFNLTGENAVGLYAVDGSTINVTNATILSAPNNNSWLLFTDNNGTINFDGVAVDENNNHLLKSTSSGNVNMTNSTLYGDIAHDGTNADILKVEFTDSPWMGSANAIGDGIINLAFDDASNWKVTGDSNTNGALAVNGNIVDYMSAPLGTTITADSLSGNGDFRMKTDIFNERADLLIVEGISVGSHQITVANQGSAAVLGTELTTLVKTADTDSSFSLTNRVELGPWIYDLRNVSNGQGGQYWELYRDSNTFNNPSSSAINTFVGSYFLNYLENDTLIQRLGDLRNEKLEDRNGAWARTFGGETDFDNKGMISGFSMDHWGVQAGYDRRLKNSWFKNGTTYVGGFFGISSANLSFREVGYGKGDVDHKSVGFYATHKANSGFYFDTVLKYVWRESKFNAVDSSGMMVNSDKIHGDGAGISLEMGRRFTIGDQSKKDGGWYVEPQVQMSFQHMNGGSYDLSNGMEIGVKSYDSMIGRAGTLFGYQTNRTNLYAKLFFLKEFNGDMDIWANGQNYGTHSLDDEWMVYGIGVSHQVNPKNSLYLDIQRSHGGDFKQKWRLNGGWRIAF